MSIRDKISLEQGSMANDFKEHLIRWAGTTAGFSLSSDESILHRDEFAMIIGLKGKPSRLVAISTFNPKQLPPGLQLELISLKMVILGDFTSEGNQRKFHPIPDWLASLHQVESLVLLDIELGNIAVCENLPLKYLDLRRVRYRDKFSVIKMITNLKHLKIFAHDESFAIEDLATIKEKLPNVKFASKSSAQGGR
jgi:hypothetical protein